MSDDDQPPQMTRLTFHGPLSEARAARLVDRLTRTHPATVLDLARGRASAVARGLAGRVSFIEESAVGTAHGPADLVLCVGASHALSEASPRQATIDALSELRRLVNPAGRVFLGECFWEHPPTPAEIAAMWPGVTADWLRGSRGLLGLAYLTLIPQA